MALDAATLARTAAELKATLTDAKIAKLFEPTRDELVLTLRTRTDTYALLLSARSGSARVCLTEESFENPETPPSFCMLMRKHLTGGRLLDVHMEPGDRIVYFDFQCTNEMGDLVRNTLCAELMLMTSMPMRLWMGQQPLSSAMARPWMPNSFGMDGPVMSASRMPQW